MSKEFISKSSPENYSEIYSIAKALCLHYKMHLYNGPIVAIYVEFTSEGMLDDFESLYDEVIQPLHNGERIKDQFEDA